MKDHIIAGMRRRMGFNVSPIGMSGGLSLWWDEYLEKDISLSSKHVIDAQV